MYKPDADISKRVSWPNLVLLFNHQESLTVLEKVAVPQDLHLLCTGEDSYSTFGCTMEGKAIQDNLCR
jgi:deoxycytidine triphosphate deaminase